MKTFKIASLAAMLLGLPAFVLAQNPGEPKAPPAYDVPGEALYRARIWAPDEKVREAQRALQGRGYYDGPIDGVLSPSTRRAVWDFQKDHGLRLTARLDPPTMTALGFPSAAAPVSPPAPSSTTLPSAGFEASGAIPLLDQTEAP